MSRRASLIDSAQLAGAKLKKAEATKESNASLNQAIMHNEINKQGIIAVPAENVPKTGTDAALAEAVTLRAINRQGVIAMPSENAPKDTSMDQAKTMVAIQKQGVKSAAEGSGPRDAGKARMMAMATIEKQGIKTANAEKAPSMAPKTDLLAEIQKEAAEEKKKIEQTQAEQKTKLDLAAIGKGSELKKAQSNDVEATQKADINRTVMMREINRQGVIAVPAENAPKVDMGLATALIHKSVQLQGVIAVPEGHAPQDASINQARTMVAIQKQGVISVPSDHAPVEAGKARMMTLATIEKQGIKSVNGEKAPSMAPKKELMADIQKEAAEEKKKIEEAQTAAKGKLDLVALGAAKLKKVDAPSTKGQDDVLSRTIMMREINNAGVIAVPAEKASKVNDPTLAAAYVQRAINTGGVIAMPSEKAPVDVALAQALTLNTIAKQGVKSANPEKDAAKPVDLKEVMAQKEEELKASTE